jgi:hypothetical protein
MCFTLRHIKEGICFIVRHISFLASWWVGTRFSAIDIGLYSRGGLNMSLQNVRGSIITARSLIIRHLSLLSGVLKAVDIWLGWHLLFQHVICRGGTELCFEKVLRGDATWRCFRLWSRVVRIWSENYPVRTFTPYLFKPILMLSSQVFQLVSSLLCVLCFLYFLNDSITPTVYGK